MAQKNNQDQEITGVVKKWSGGGAYVSVPSALAGKIVKIVIVNN